MHINSIVNNVYNQTIYIIAMCRAAIWMQHNYSYEMKLHAIQVNVSSHYMYKCSNTAPSLPDVCTISINVPPLTHEV